MKGYDNLDTPIPLGQGFTFFEVRCLICKDLLLLVKGYDQTYQIKKGNMPGHFCYNCMTTPDKLGPYMIPKVYKNEQE